MKRCIVAVLTAAAIWSGILPVMSAENSIVGTWQLTSFSLIFLDTKETSRLDRPTGYIQFSPGGHMVMFLTAGELKPPASTLMRNERMFIERLSAHMRGPTP
jgi:hypothetical protein